MRRGEGWGCRTSTAKMLGGSYYEVRRRSDQLNTIYNQYYVAPIVIEDGNDNSSRLTARSYAYIASDKTMDRLYDARDYCNPTPP